MKLRPFSSWSWLWAGAGLIAGGVVHVSTILALPLVAPNDAWVRLKSLVAENEMVVLPPTTAGQQPLRFMSSDLRYAVCRYRLAQADLRVRVELLHKAWSVSLYNRLGYNIYTVSGSELRRRNVEFVISRKRDNDVALLPLKDKEAQVAIRVTVPERVGLVVVRAPIIGEAYRGQADRAIKNASCALDAPKPKLRLPKPAEVRLLPGAVPLPERNPLRDF